MAICKHCNEWIEWGRAPSGRNIPLAASPTPNGRYVIERGAGGNIARDTRTADSDPVVRASIAAGSPRHDPHDCWGGL